MRRLICSFNRDSEIIVKNLSKSVLISQKDVRTDFDTVVVDLCFEPRCQSIGLY